MKDYKVVSINHDNLPFTKRCSYLPMTDTASEGFVSNTLSSYILLLYMIAITSPFDRHAKFRSRASSTALGFVISKNSGE